MKKHFLQNICFLMMISLFSTVLFAQRMRVDSVVAIVNDEAVTMTDLQRSLLPLVKQLKGKYSGEELQKKINEAANAVLSQLIENKLILHTAINLKDQEEIKIPEKEILKYVQKIVDRFPSKEVFEEALKMENLSFEDFKKDCIDQLLVKELVARKVSSKIFVTNNDIKKYYETHQEDFTSPAKVTFSQIWLKKDGKDSEKKKLMEKIQEELSKGTDFKSLAVQYSEGPHAMEGGIWKNVVKGQFTKELDETIWSLSPGQISSLIETSVSFHLVKVEVIEKSRTVPLEEVWDKIQNQIYFEKAEQLRKEWLDKLRKEAFIETYYDSM